MALMSTLSLLMSILKRTYYSLLNRGIIGSIDNLITIIEDLTFDRRYGTDTSLKQ